jgi:hypothetical protein
VLVAETVAPGMMAPELSWIVPTRLPSSNCASATFVPNRNSKLAKNEKEMFLRIRVISLKIGSGE